MIKKYLIAGALALICNFVLTSCREDMENYGSLEDAKKAQFAQNFENFYGKPDENQLWGFEDDGVAASRVKTRTVIKQDFTNYPTQIAPDPITQKEADWVTNWFQNNPGLTEQGQPFHNFFIQFVSGDQSNKKGIWHRYDQNRVNNGHDSNYWDEAFTDNGGMDKLHVGAVRDQNQTEHVNDFNAKTGGPWDVVYIQDGSALQFGYHSSWGEDDKAPNKDGYYWYFKMVELNVPGNCFEDGQARKGWYVGLSLYGKKWDNGDKELGAQRLNYAEDWILKVVPGDVLKKKEVIDHKWVFCEDLGSAADRRDYDYNDLVFDAKIIEEYNVIRDSKGVETEFGNDAHKVYAEITPLAAGGELAIWINSDNNDLIHSLFGSGVANNVLINTCRQNQEISMSHQEGLSVRDKIIIPFNSLDEAKIKNIIINVQNSGFVYEITAEKGEAPHKICVPPGTRWPYERTPIDSAYTEFPAYVGNPSIIPWNNYDSSKVYPIDDLSNYLTDNKTDSAFYEMIDGASNIIYSYTLLDAVNEHKLWDDEKDFAWGSDQSVEISADAIKNAGVINGTIIRIYGITSDAFNVKVTYLNQEGWGNIDLENDDWVQNYNDGTKDVVDKCNFYSNTARSFVQFTLTAATAENFKNNGMRIYGNNFKALCVTYDNSQKVVDETPETPHTGGSVIWSSTNYSSQQLIPASTLSNNGLKKDQAATVKVTGTQPYSWGWGGIDVMASWETVSASHSSSTPEYAETLSDGKLCISIPVSADGVNKILNSEGMRIGIYNFNPTKVEVVQ